MFVIHLWNIFYLQLATFFCLDNLFLLSFNVLTKRHKSNLFCLLIYFEIWSKTWTCWKEYRGIVENKNSLKFASHIILGLSCYLQVCFLCSGVSLWRLCTSKSCFTGKIYCILQAHSSFSGVMRIHAIAEHERRYELAG